MHKVLRIVLLWLVLLMLVTPLAAQDEPTETPPPTETLSPTETPPPTETLSPTETPLPEPTPIPPPPAPPPTTETNYLGWIVGIVVAFAIVLIVLGNQFIVQLGASVPALVYEVSKGAVYAGLDEAKRIADATPTKTDDEAVAEMRDKINELVKAIEELRKVNPPLSGVAQTITKI